MTLPPDPKKGGGQPGRLGQAGLLSGCPAISDKELLYKEAFSKALRPESGARWPNGAHLYPGLGRKGNLSSPVLSPLVRGLGVLGV